jgi:hypothetical protein
MRLIIEARLVDGDGDTVEEGGGVLAVVERPDCSLAELGLTLAEGRSLLAKVQAELISKQVQWWLSGQTRCQKCGAALSHKDSRSTVLRTVYGKVTVKSLRLWSCACQETAQTPQRVVHPLSKALIRRVTPELEYIAMKFKAAERSVFGSKMIDSMERESVETEKSSTRNGWSGMARAARR